MSTPHCWCVLHVLALTSEIFLVPGFYAYSLMQYTLQLPKVPGAAGTHSVQTCDQGLTIRGNIAQPKIALASQA